MSQIKPQLACDFDAYKLQFPYIMSYKVDGVRALGLSEHGGVVGRSLKPFKNRFVHDWLWVPESNGFDGELVLGDWTSARLCSETTGFVNRKTPKDGKPTESDELKWYIYDYLHPDFVNKPYEERMEAAHRVANQLAFELAGCSREDAKRFYPMPWKMANSLEDILEFEDRALDLGFEGVILRDPGGLHKSGRASVKTNSYLRIKRFVDFEGVILEIKEAMENRNAPKINELGRTERSTHAENMVPKGMAGSIVMCVIKDVVDRGAIVLYAGDIVEVGPGNLTHPERIEMYINRATYTGKVGKAKMFPKGLKDKPRFPTFTGLRAEEDMSD